ncbi:hypothetical protein [Pseudaminobacter sp. NGMCC 1.201702]|uniref:hypothetical protein n=1 Tax=Pseudaminobacter sp. NGMCC 1.201702 TaxID=3391825 RepID=UPI0039F022B1
MDPAKLISDCIKASIVEHAGPIQRFRKTLPVDKLGALGFSISFKTPSDFSGTPSEAMQLLAVSTDRDVVLIVDEAQHSLETEAGLDAMFALKAARDAVNQGQSGRHLYLIMTGSHRDKLAALVYDQKSPFFGAQVRDFPPLGREYSIAIADRINRNLAEHLHIGVDEIDRAFDILGRKPEMLLDCLRALVLAEGIGAEALAAIVTRKKAEVEAARRAEIMSLTKLQQALLRMLAADGQAFSPFAAASRDRLKSANGGRAPAQGAIQQALDVLRSKGFIWRPGYGAYALENAEIAGALMET